MEIEHSNSERKRLPNRLACETFGFECAALRYTATISRFDARGAASSPLGTELDILAAEDGGGR
jgi:hypothetical protein